MTIERVHYNCVCDEGISLRCANEGCGRDIEPEGLLVITPDGTVYCSEGCARPVAVPS
jgi:hypothetical protein